MTLLEELSNWIGRRLDMEIRKMKSDLFPLVLELELTGWLTNHHKRNELNIGYKIFIVLNPISVHSLIIWLLQVSPRHWTTLLSPFMMWRIALHFLVLPRPHILYCIYYVYSYLFSHAFSLLFWPSYLQPTQIYVLTIKYVYIYFRQYYRQS